MWAFWKHASIFGVINWRDDSEEHYYLKKIEISVSISENWKHASTFGVMNWRDAWEVDEY